MLRCWYCFALEEAASPNKYFDFGDDVDEEFETPPDSPDDVKMVLPAELEREIADTQLAEDYIKKNQESIAKSLGVYFDPANYLCL